ncbi:MAG: hypothetical protein ABEJ90_04210 [Halobacterium sp.]
MFFDRDTEQRRVVAYSLPGPVDASSGSVGGRPLSDDELAFLADPAAFSVPSVSVPDSARKGSHAPVSVTARNGGGTAGTFRAAATSQSIRAFDVGKVAVEPGGRASVELEVPVNGDGEERVDVTWGSDGVERTVAVES